jgi:hypothetical protein
MHATKATDACRRSSGTTALAISGNAAEVLTRADQFLKAGIAVLVAAGLSSRDRDD